MNTPSPMNRASSSSRRVPLDLEGQSSSNLQDFNDHDDSVFLSGNDEDLVNKKDRHQFWREQATRAKHAIARNRLIVLIPLLLFAALIGSGAAVIVTTSNSHNRQACSEARLLAIETGEWFASQLDLAIAPLFSLAQFVKQLDELYDLADQIGEADDDTGEGAPFLPPPNNQSTVPTHRNVTGICDNPEVLKRYNEIAAAIKQSAKMEKVLVNLQIAPHAVVCMLYPLNNTEDFDDGSGTFLDNQGAVGHDLLNDPARSFIARATVPSDRVVIAGPLTLRQCPQCPAAVKQAFIARLPIDSKPLDQHTIEVDGIDYPKWGFAVALINWAALVERSNIHQQFATRDYTFKLTRLDRIEDGETGRFTEKVVTLSESPNFDSSSRFLVSTALSTTNNEWVITIDYSTATTKTWLPWGCLVAFAFASCFAVLTFIVLLQKQVHSDLDSERTLLLAQHAKQAAQNQRDLNEHLAHEVRNPLSAALSACTFVSYALQEEERTSSSSLNGTTAATTTTTSQASQSPKLVRVESGQGFLGEEEGEQQRNPVETTTETTRLREVREDVHIIHTSLRFINELLRSILDTNRACDKSMVLEKVEVDIWHDIFEPVSSMIYQRDHLFDFIIERNGNEKDDLIIETDRLRLQQVVLNISRNAAKYVEKGFIRLRALEQPGDDGRSRVCIYVEDSGPGIPRDKRNNLFHRFQESLDTMAQGTGVGLNLCKKLVDLMGGRIYLDDTYHSGVEGCPGTRIVIELNPNVKCYKRQTSTACADAVAEQEPQQTPTIPATLSMESLPPDEPSSVMHIQDSSVTDGLLMVPSGNPLEEPQQHQQDDCSVVAVPQDLSVLFVDDDRVLRKLATRAVKTVFPQCHFREAASGEAALQILETAATSNDGNNKEFDFIFMDQYMTSVDQALKGTETVRAMRARGCQSIICGLSANDIESSFLNAGANAFWLKPFPCKREEVLEALQRLWALKQQQPPQEQHVRTSCGTIEAV